MRRRMLPGDVPRSPMITHPAWFVAEAWNTMHAEPPKLRVDSEKKRSSVVGVFVRFCGGLKPPERATAQNTSPNPIPVTTPGSPASAVGSTWESVKRRNATYVSEPSGLKPTCGQSTDSVLKPGS